MEQNELDELEQQPVEAEQQRPHPQIYVASLSDYNAGRLHGAWLDATAEVEELQAAIDAMLSRSPVPGAEEYAIHDYDGFWPVRVDEHARLDLVVQLARGLHEHGTAFGHWANYVSFDADQLERFDYVYCGSWDSLEQWLEESAVDFEAQRALEQLPDWLRPYVSVDYQALGRDIAMDAYVAEDDHGVHVFEVL